MAKEETLSVSKDLQELQRKLSLLIESIQKNSKVVAFMESPVGQYLDRHPFAALTLLVFVAVSAVPVGFFLLVVVLTSLAAFVGVILLEGLVICVGGLSLLCVLCGLGFVSLVMSGTITVSYMVVSSLVNYWFSSSPFVCHLVATRKMQWLWRHQLHSRQDEGRKKTSPPSPIDSGPVYQTSDTKLQWRLPAGYEVRRLTGALPGMTGRTEPELFSSHLWKVVGSYGPRGIMTQAGPGTQVLPGCAP